MPRLKSHFVGPDKITDPGTAILTVNILTRSLKLLTLREITLKISREGNNAGGVESFFQL